MLTLNAKPWLVIHRAIRTPIAASFSSPTHTPVSPAMRIGRDPVVGRCSDQHFFEIANVAMDVAAIGIQVDDRIADDLSGPVIRDVAAAPGFVHLDAARGQRFVGRENVSAAAVSANAEREDIGCSSSSSVSAMRPARRSSTSARCKVERLGVRHARRAVARRASRGVSYGAPAFQPILPLPACTSAFGSQFSSACFTIDMNSSATAPSISAVIVAERQVRHRPDRDRIVDDDRPLLDRCRRRGSRPAAG